MPPKRPVKIEPGAASAAPPSKRAKAVKPEPAVTSSADIKTEDLKERFILLFSKEQYKNGIANSQLKSIFGEDEYPKLVPIINTLSQQKRIEMSNLDGDETQLFFILKSEEEASKFVGLDPSAHLV